MAAGLAIPHGPIADELTGRDAEVAEIAAFFSATAGVPSALVIVGEVGIGKTAVWKHAVRSVAGTHRVLACRPARAEAPLAFAALDDLFGGALDEILPELPEARRQALEIALRGFHAEQPVAGKGGAGGPGSAAGGPGRADGLGKAAGGPWNGGPWKASGGPGRASGGPGRAGG